VKDKCLTGDLLKQSILRQPQWLSDSNKDAVVPVSWHKKTNQEEKFPTGMKDVPQ